MATIKKLKEKKIEIAGKNCFDFTQIANYKLFEEGLTGSSFMNYNYMNDTETSHEIYWKMAQSLKQRPRGEQKSETVLLQNFCSQFFELYELENTFVDPLRQLVYDCQLKKWHSNGF